MLQRRCAIWLIAVFSACSARSVATAQPQLEDPIKQCAGVDPAARIQGCTQLLKEGELVGASLAGVYSNRGAALGEIGQPDKAILDFNQAIELAPSYAGAYLNRGVVYDAMGQTKRAIQDYDQAISLDPGYAAPYNNRCYAKAELGILKEALADCEKSLSLEPGDARTLDTLGYVYLRLSAYDRALQAYTAALSASPDLPTAMYGRAVARSKLGDAAGALKDLAAAQKTDSGISLKMEKIGLRLEGGTLSKDAHPSLVLDASRQVKDPMLASKSR